MPSPAADLFGDFDEEGAVAQPPLDRYDRYILQAVLTDFQACCARTGGDANEAEASLMWFWITTANGNAGVLSWLEESIMQIEDFPGVEFSVLESCHRGVLAAIAWCSARDRKAKHHAAAVGRADDALCGPPPVDAADAVQDAVPDGEAKLAMLSLQYRRT